MTAHCSSSIKPAPLLFVECDYGKLGVEFQATDRLDNSRADIVKQIRLGGINPRKVLEVDEAAGTCRDITAELIAEAELHEPMTLDEAFDRLRGMLIDRADQIAAERDRAYDLRKHEQVA